MPVGAIAAAGLAVNTITGVIQGINQLNRAKKYEQEYMKAIKDFTPEERENVYRGLRVPTTREEIARKDIGASTATALDIASKQGVAGYGFAQNVLRREQDVLDEIASSYEDKSMRIQELIAGDERRRQQMTFQEEQAQLQMLGQGLSSARQMGEQAREGIYDSLRSGVSGATNLALGQSEMDLTREIYGLPEKERNSIFDILKKKDRLKSAPMGGEIPSYTQPSYNPVYQQDNLA